MISITWIKLLNLNICGNYWSNSLNYFYLIYKSSNRSIKRTLDYSATLHDDKIYIKKRLVE